MIDNPDLSSKLIRNSTAEFLIFTAQDGDSSIEARYEDETIWLTQRLMAELFDVDVRTISEHLGNVFSSGELEREATIRKFRIVRSEGSRQVTRSIEHYNLDAIISVGYRVNSVRATQFRQWPPACCVTSPSAATSSTVGAWRTAPSSARTTSSTCSTSSVRSACPSAASARKLPTSTPPASTTTRTPLPPKRFFVTVQNKLR